MKENVMENGTVQCWHEDGILYGVFKIPVLDIDGAKIALETRLKVAGGVSFPFLVDARGVKSISKEARDYLASDDGTQNVNASALLLESALGRFLGNFFLQLSKPKVPTRLFTSENDALEWLGQYKKTKSKK